MSKIIVAILCTIFFLPGKTQAQFNPIWNAFYQHTTAADFSNESRHVATDNSGNVFVLADVTSDIDPSGNSSPSTWHYVTLLKYNDQGILVDSEVLDIQNHI